MAEDYQNLVSLPYPTLRAIATISCPWPGRRNIALRLEVNVPPGLALNEFDLAVIFGNLLDNALEANRQLGEAGRYLELRIVYKPDYLLIHTENPYDSAATAPGGRRRSTKPDADSHGFGLQNIGYLVKKYSGLLDLTRVGGVFRADIALLAEKYPKNRHRK